MLEIFRNNHFITSLLLLPYIFILRLHTLIYPVAYYFDDQSNSFLTHFLFGGFNNPYYQSIVAVLLVFIQSVLVNYIFVYHKYCREITLFAGLFYALFVSINPATNLLNPVLIANTFVLLALHNLLKSSRIAQAAPYIFNSGFFIALAGLIYTPYTILFIFGVLALIVVRSFKIQEKLQYLAGFVTPVYLLAVLLYWNDADLGKLKLLKGVFFNIPTPEYPVLFFRLMPVFMILLSIPFVLLQYNNLTGRKNVQVQKKSDILYWLMLFGLVSYLLFQNQGQYHFLTLAVPVAILTGMFVSDSKKRVAAELIHLMILIFAGISQYG